MNTTVAMKIRFLLGLIPLALLCDGCGHHENFRGEYDFLDKEVTNWHQIAVEAATSPEMWAKTGGVRLTKGPPNIDLSGIVYNVDCPDLDKVQVVIPCFYRKEPGTFIKIIIDRVTHQVLSMNEEAWGSGSL
jgi:hypothetical protein